jgi:hypothetical protein
MALSPNQLPVLASGFTSGFTTSYLDTTSWSPKNFPMSTFNWTPVQDVINVGVDFYNLPNIVKINLNILKLALRQGYITLPKNYKSGQIPFIQG